MNISSGFLHMDTKTKSLVFLVGLVLLFGAIQIQGSNHDSVQGVPEGDEDIQDTSGSFGESSEQKSSEENSFENQVRSRGVSSEEKDGVRTYSFNKEDASLKIGNKTFENIDSERTNNIRVNSEGEILSASFRTNEDGGTYNIGGTNFTVSGSEPISFSNGTLNLPHDAKINSINNSKMAGKKITTSLQKDVPRSVLSEGKDSRLQKGLQDNPRNLDEIKSKVVLPGGRALRGGAKFTEKGMVLQPESNLYKETYDVGEYIVESGKTISTGKGSTVLVAEEGADMSNYGGSWIKSDNESVRMSSSGKGRFSLDVSEESGLFRNRGDNLETTFSVYDGAKMDIDRQGPNKPYLVTNDPSSKGTSIVETGSKSIRVHDSQLYVERARDVPGSTTVNMEITSNPDSAKSIETDKDGSAIIKPSGIEVEPENSRTRSTQENIVTDDVGSRLNQETQ